MDVNHTAQCSINNPADALCNCGRKARVQAATAEHGWGAVRAELAAQPVS